MIRIHFSDHMYWRDTHSLSTRAARNISLFNFLSEDEGKTEDRVE
jgi:hypothetical protein